MLPSAARRGGTVDTTPTELYPIDVAIGGYRPGGGAAAAIWTTRLPERDDYDAASAGPDGTVGCASAPPSAWEQRRRGIVAGGLVARAGAHPVNRIVA